GDRAEHEADREARGDGDETDHERVAGPVDDPRELVAAEGVEPHRVRLRRAGAAAAVERDREQVLLVRVVRGEQRRENGAEREQEHEREAGDRTGVAAQAAEGVAPESAGRRIERALGDLDLELGGLDRHQLTRIRGLMTAYEMSTSRFTITNTTARKRIPPWSTG